MSTTEEKPKKKITEGRRSSLKTTDTNPHKFLKIKEKRHSVSWGKSDTFQFKQMKATFQESKDVEIPLKEKEAKETKHKEFVENRRKSIKDEFSLVKELMKKNIIEEEDDEEYYDEEEIFYNNGKAKSVRTSLKPVTVKSAEPVRISARVSTTSSK